MLVHGANFYHSEEVFGGLKAVLDIIDPGRGSLGLVWHGNHESNTLTLFTMSCPVETTA
jgi:hypothetical protein